MNKIVHFEGSCDVCKAPISLDWNPLEGIIDYRVNDEGRMVTWVRHYATAPPDANPACAVYSSECVEMVEKPE